MESDLFILLCTPTFCTVCLHVSQEGLEVSWMELLTGNRHLLLCCTKLSSPYHPRSFLQTWVEHYCQGVVKIFLIGVTQSEGVQVDEENCEI